MTKPKGRRGFIKSAETETSVERSKAELEKIIRRYGASHFGIQADYTTGKAEVFFKAPNDFEGDDSVPVKLTVDPERVAGRLFPDGATDNQRHQAERVAWRHMVLWVDAALCLAATGTLRVQDAFMAGVVLQDGEGGVATVAEIVERELASGNVKLLPAGDA